MVMMFYWIVMMVRAVFENPFCLKLMIYLSIGPAAYQRCNSPPILPSNGYQYQLPLPA